jgi:hypothetical protein
MDSLTPFHVGWDEFMDSRASFLVHDFVLVTLLLVLLMLVPREPLAVFFLMITLALFLELIFRHAS